MNRIESDEGKVQTKVGENIIIRMEDKEKTNDKD